MSNALTLDLWNSILPLAGLSALVAWLPGWFVGADGLSQRVLARAGVKTAAVALVGVFVLFFFQVSPGANPDGSGRVASAFGYMTSEGIMWVASFLVGAAVGSLIWKARRAK